VRAQKPSPPSNARTSCDTVTTSCRPCASGAQPGPGPNVTPTSRRERRRRYCRPVDRAVQLHLFMSGPVRRAASEQAAAKAAVVARPADRAPASLPPRRPRAGARTREQAVDEADALARQDDRAFASRSPPRRPRAGARTCEQAVDEAAAVGVTRLAQFTPASQPPRRPRAGVAHP